MATPTDLSTSSEYLMPASSVPPLLPHSAASGTELSTSDGSLLDSLFLHPPALTDLLAGGTITVHTATIPAEESLALGFWNIAGNWMLANKISAIAGLLQTYQLDYLALVDSGDSAMASSWATTCIAREVPGFIAAVTPVQAETPNLVIGGITLLLGPRCSSPRPQLWQDKSGLGLVSGLTIATPSSKLLILAVYFPTQTASSEHTSDKLEVQLRNWLRRERRVQTPREFIWTSITSKARKHLKTPGNRVVIGGDLNMLAEEALLELQSLGTVLMPFSHPDTDKPTRSVAEGARRIDHIAGVGTIFASHTLHSDPAYALISDHYPLTCTISHDIPTQYRLPPARRPRDLALQNSRMVEAYQKAVTEFVNTEPSPTLSELCLFSAQALQRTTTTTAGGYGPRHLWSPRMIALTWWHRLLRQVQSSGDKLEGRIQLLQACHQRVKDIGKDGPQLWEYLQGLGMTAERLRTCTRQDSTVLSQTIKETRRLSHAKGRQAERDVIRSLCRAREESLQSGKIKRALQSLLPTERLFFEMTYLQVSPDLPPLLDPMHIYEQIADNFKRWYALPDHPAARLGHDTWALWKDNPALLDEYLSALHIPAHQATILKQGILVPSQSRNTARVFLDLRSKEAIMPTFEEFQAAIAATPAGKAPGPSGLTYNMIKGWPLEVQEWAYKCLCELWNSPTMGDWWSTKLLYPIPKDAAPTLSTLRPIMLLESLRKVWMRVIIRKISSSLERCGVLSSAQYGFRPHRNTGQAILQVINAMEEAEEEASVIYLTSWDITRAFDSIPRPVIDLALQRLGIPHDLAIAIAFMDDFDNIYPATPWFRAFPERAAPFRSHKGTGQGDVSSPLLWCAFFDILLRALEMVPSDFQVRGANGHLATIGDTAYADDLLSISASSHNLQAKADIVSAFAVAFGLDLALHKFRTSATTWGSEHRITAAGIVVHTGQWTPHLVPFTEEAHIKYLGSLQSRSNRGEEEGRRMDAIVSTAARSLSTKKASPELVLKAISLVTQAKANYAGQFGAWPLRNYQKWDTALNKVIKAKLHALQSYPQALLAAPVAHGGLGIQSTSVRIQEAKWRLLHEALLSLDSQTRLAGEGLVERGARATGTSLTNEGSCIVASRLPDGVTYWIRSLAEFLALNQVQLRAPPLLATSYLDQPIESCLRTLSVSTKTRLMQIGILRVGDAVQADHRSEQFQIIHLPNSDLGPWQGWESGTVIGPRQPLHFWPGQVWMRPDETGRWCAADEILGWTARGPTIRRWSLLTRPTLRTTNATGFLQIPLLCQLSTPTRGGGSDLTIEWAEALQCYKVKGLLDSDKRHRTGLRRLLLGWHRIVPCLPELATSPPRPDWAPAPTLHGLLASDASWTSSAASFDPSVPTAQGIGVVLMTEEDRGAPSYSLHVGANSWINSGRAYTLEAIALAIACLIASFVPITKIFSDCKGAVKVIGKRVEAGQRLLQLRRSISCTRPRPPVEWTPGHPEKRKGESEYTQADWANCHSDSAAAGNAVGRVHHEIDITTALTVCAAHYPGWATCRGSALEILTPSERYRQELMDSYLFNRQQRHPGEGPWTRSALVFAMGSRGQLSLRQRVAVLNLFLGRFDRDRRYRAQALHQCDCGNGPASLHCWVTTCTCPEIVDVKQTLYTHLQEACGQDLALRTAIFSMLYTQMDIRAWRGNWPPAAFQHLKLSKITMEKLTTITGLVIEASLDMHSLASARERKLEHHAPATAASSTSRRSTLLRSSQLGSHLLTDFGFSIRRSGTATSSTSSIWEPP